MRATERASNNEHIGWSWGDNVLVVEEIIGYFHSIGPNRRVGKVEHVVPDFFIQSELTQAVVVQWGPQKARRESARDPRSDPYYIGHPFDLDVDYSRIQISGINNNAYSAKIIEDASKPARKAIRKIRLRIKDRAALIGTAQAKREAQLAIEHATTSIMSNIIVRPVNIMSTDCTLKTLRRLLSPAPAKSQQLLEWEKKLGTIPWSSLKELIVTPLVDRHKAALVWRIAHNVDWMGEKKLRAYAKHNERDAVKRQLKAGDFVCPHCRHTDPCPPVENWIHILSDCPVADAVWAEATRMFKLAHGLWLPNFRVQHLFGPLPSVALKKALHDDARDCLVIVMH